MISKEGIFFEIDGIRFVVERKRKLRDCQVKMLNNLGVAIVQSKFVCMLLSPKQGVPKYK